MKIGTFSHDLRYPSIAQVDPDLTVGQWALLYYVVREYSDDPLVEQRYIKFITIPYLRNLIKQHREALGPVEANDLLASLRYEHIKHIEVATL